MLMKMIADLHIHSRFSMATSKEGTPENLDFWARKKGISLIGTGDFTHPVWREELKERLVSEGNGPKRPRLPNVAFALYHSAKGKTRRSPILDPHGSDEV